MAAARPLARAMLDVSLPGDAVLDDVQRLVRNLIAMNEILRDTESVSVRLVMTPDRMVVDEARRTFTYLNLYGYLTDAVVVNRVFPEEVGPVLRRVARAPARGARGGPVRLRARAGAARAVLRRGGRRRRRCSIASARTSSRTATPAPSCTQRLTQELVVGADAAELRLDLPFAEKGEISLKKIGLELVVRVDGHKRTLMLPPALGDYRPTGASFDDGALHVTFDGPA